MDKRITQYDLSHMENLCALMAVEYWSVSTQVQKKFLVTFLYWE